MHRRLVGVGAVAALALCAVALGGCGPYASGRKTATAGANASAAAPTSIATPMPAVTRVPGGHTGIPSVDAALDAVAARDASALVKQVQLAKIGCITEPQGIGAPPFCLPSEAEGTQIEVLPVAQCEGFYARQDEVAQLMTSFLGESAKLYAVYDAEPDSFPPGTYVAVFATKASLPITIGRALYLNDDGITGVHLGCSQTPDQFVDFNRLTGRWILPPPDRQPPHDTGVPSVDAALRALAAGDEDALLAQMHSTGVPCRAQGLGGAPMCTPRVPDGTLSQVYFSGGCESRYFPADPQTDRSELEKIVAFNKGPAPVFGAYRMPEGTFPTQARYSIVLSSPDGVGDDATPAPAIEIWLDDQGIVGFDGACYQTRGDLVDILGRVPLGETAPTPTPLATPPSGLTGIASVDAAITAVLDGDLDALAAQVVYSDLPCMAEPQSDDLGPVCKPGEADGTVVRATFEGICEPFYVRADEQRRNLSGLVDTRTVWFAAYDSVQDRSVKEARYGVIFDTASDGHPDTAIRLLLDDQGIVGIEGCGNPPSPVGSWGREILMHLIE